MGKTEELEEEQETGVFGQALGTSIAAQPQLLPSFAFAHPVYLVAAAGLGMQGGVSGNIQPLFEFDPPAL